MFFRTLNKVLLFFFIIANFPAKEKGNGRKILIRGGLIYPSYEFIDKNTQNPKLEDALKLGYKSKSYLHLVEILNDKKIFP
jgi:hypothetical protein